MEKSPRVFVVDPDPDMRFQVQQLIPQAGFTTAGQSGLGTEAVALASEIKPNLVLCGLREPVVRVVQTIESIAHALPDIPIVVYAESGEIETIRKAMLAGARDFLQAPLKPDDLRRSLTTILEWEERRKLRDGSNNILGLEGAVITVFGPKGGVGKTTIAANLAVALVRSASQVVALVDADDAFGDAADTLAVTSDRSVVDVIRSMDGLDGEALKQLLAVHESGLAVAAAPASPFEWKDLGGEHLELLVQRLARQFDIVLIDTGGTMSDVNQAALEAATLVLWLTTPEYASVRDSLQAFQAIGRLRVPQDRIRVVLNVTSPEVEVRPGSIEEALGQEIFWTIPYDRLLRRSAQMGQAVVDAHPESAASQNLSDLALVLSGMPPQSRNGAQRRRIFGREAGTSKRKAGKAREEAKR